MGEDVAAGEFKGTQAAAQEAATAASERDMVFRFPRTECRFLASVNPGDRSFGVRLQQVARTQMLTGHCTYKSTINYCNHRPPPTLSEAVSKRVGRESLVGPYRLQPFPP